MNSLISLHQLGWQPFFQQQLALDEYEHATIARIVTIHRNEYVVQTNHATLKLAIDTESASFTVGDWLLLDTNNLLIRRLERKSLFRRKAAGSAAKAQQIAANVDTLFVVCSLNHDFNLSRIERYLALAHDAQVEPVVVLTKQDMCNDAEDKCSAVQQLDPMLRVVSVDARDQSSCLCLADWTQQGQSIALLGSSGVGKSTLVNTLMGQTDQQIGEIRQDDSKGRHTTTARSIHFLPSGAVLIDTPGMRELQLAACEQGVKQTFADVEALASQCRFSDCQHTTEPGCSIQQALASKALDPRRLSNYRKLLSEQARNSATLAERRAKDKAFGKMVKTVGTASRHVKKGY
ncbi:ribosome small subunit-dependent GTPase A [Neiella marina]|uniref:Small ribosomal subunit biogenesis GTPase RsgA n=1 Tax=Neiella holothuriorum TaxID=2870530 RepID=A0ABS7ECN7_9GAMM|nr:ribosome small subunit-dependent GTPase A [Neiella holothuriorum]MBW8190099.1 ribosome small subunit-dependent GTPase A [Neiella holothuriorum]